MGQSLKPPASLSVHWAFVVEFDADADLQVGRVIGRVEHVVSGRATSFQSQEMLLAFMAQVLREVRGDSAQRELHDPGNTPVAIDVQRQSVRDFFQRQY
jgi:hypothetical protein